MDRQSIHSEFEKTLKPGERPDKEDYFEWLQDQLVNKWDIVDGLLQEKGYFGWLAEQLVKKWNIMDGLLEEQNDNGAK